MPASKPRALLMVFAALSLMTTACGAESEETAPPAAAVSQEATETRIAEAGAIASAEIACDLTREDLNRIGIERQLVLNLSLAKGANLKAMRETMTAPDPETFRRLGTIFEGFHAAEMAPSPIFDAPDKVAADLLKTAELLENALATGENLADPAWTELAAFYDQKFFVRHNSAVNYYLGEAGCR